MWKGVIETYRRYLPVSGKTPVVTMLEGNTPLIEAKNLSKYLRSGPDSIGSAQDESAIA